MCLTPFHTTRPGGTGLAWQQRERSSAPWRRDQHSKHPGHGTKFMIRLPKSSRRFDERGFAASYTLIKPRPTILHRAIVSPNSVDNSILFRGCPTPCGLPRVRSAGPRRRGSRGMSGAAPRWALAYVAGQGWCRSPCPRRCYVVAPAIRASRRLRSGPSRLLRRRGRG